MNSAEDQALRLARRLRSLRIEAFGGRRLTQGELAEAIGTSVPLISSWESATNPKIPPRERLFAYATFFATERSVTQAPFQVLPDSQLTSAERIRRDELFQELTGLRNGVRSQEPGPTAIDPFAGSRWRFPPGEHITIVCSALHPRYLESIPYANPNIPDYVDLYRFADLDALLELHGHLCAANPLSDIRVRTPDEVTSADDLRHLVLLGGIDWNTTTAQFLRSLDVPVQQLSRMEAEPGGFLVEDGEHQQLFEPVLQKEGDKEILIEDIAHFFRAPSPLNDERTLTICNGMYARGTLGAVRALTDKRFRDRNEAYLRRRFAGENTFSILSRVKVFLRKAVAPDWSNSSDLLHEWPVPAM